MAERGFGRIIHITSQQAHRAFVQSSAYGVPKGALESLARSQAEAWAPYGVTCNTLVPGFVMTPLNARLSPDPEKVAAPAARTMVGRNGHLEWLCPHQAVRDLRTSRSRFDETRSKFGETGQSLRRRSLA